MPILSANFLEAKQRWNHRSADIADGDDTGAFAGHWSQFGDAQGKDRRIHDGVGQSAKHQAPDGDLPVGEHRDQHQRHAKDAQYHQHLLRRNPFHQEAAQEAASHDEQVIDRNHDSGRFFAGDTLAWQYWMQIEAREISTPT